jgi:hypothetical protein
MPGPFNRSDTKYFQPSYGASQPLEVFAQTWYTSSRLGSTGQLDLQPQPFSRSKRRNMTYSQTAGSLGQYVQPPSTGVVTSNEPPITKAFESMYNTCYGKLMSKVKGDTASLGVSLSQWRQSWTMIKLMNDRIHSYAKQAALEANRRNRNGKRLKKERASDVFLEYQFGWVPCLQDIVSTAQVLCQSDPSGWYSGRTNSTLGLPDGTMTSTRKETGRVARLRRCLNVKVEVSNPNLWLVSQLGLVNPATIAWDLVPWSFLVNQFVNVNQLLSYISDDFGLFIGNVSDTKTTQLFDNVWMSNGYPTSHPFYAQGSSSAMQMYKARTLLGGLPRPHLQVKMPELTMTKGLLAAALATQQIRRLRS